MSTLIELAGLSFNHKLSIVWPTWRCFKLVSNLLILMWYQCWDFNTCHFNSYTLPASWKPQLLQPLLIMRTRLVPSRMGKSGYIWQGVHFACTCTICNTLFSVDGARPVRKTRCVAVVTQTVAWEGNRIQVHVHFSPVLLNPFLDASLGCTFLSYSST